MKNKKGNKKILLIAAAVAVWYFFLRKGNRTETKQHGGSSTPVGAANIDVNSVESILGGLDFTEAERLYIRKFNKKVLNTTFLYQEIRNKSAKNGCSFEQQIVCDAIWLMYIVKNADGSETWKSPRGWIMIQKVDGLF